MRWGLEVSRCSGVTLRIVAHPAEATAISGGDNEHIEIRLDRSGQEKTVAGGIYRQSMLSWN